jgi:two-component system chemotaxis sensor kinase CheA
MTDIQRQVYVDEAVELLGDLEVSLLELEGKPNDAELVGRVFRVLHTIKGSGAMFGFDAIAYFTHQLETAFDGVRDGRVVVTPELVGVALDARDHIQLLLDEPQSAAAELSAAGAKILDRLRRVAPEADAKRQGAARQPQIEVETSGQARTYRIHFGPEPGILLTGNNPLLLLRELSQLGECSLIANLDRIPDLGDFDPEQCYTSWDASLRTSAGENAIRDVFIFVEHRAEVTIQLMEVEQSPEDCGAGLISLGEALERANCTRETARRPEAAATLRVSADKLDSLVNIVGELVTVQARLSGYATASGSAEASLIAEEVERLTERLRETTMGVRMLPIGDTFSRFKRLVRDLSSELGKQAELTTDGDETELDKTVIEQLSDPLVHLVRNAVDHGIESPEERRAAGKPAIGKVHLSACHTGAFVLIQVTDDGAGMDRDALRAQAVERGIIPPGAVLTDQETLALIFKPGFSTAKHVTEISGRGVGMDVVQRSLDVLRGTLSVTSQPGQGSTVGLKIPLTLAIIDGLLVEAAGAFYVMPLSNISECIELSRHSRGQSGRTSLINVRGELAPYIVLRDHFGLSGEPPAIEQVIVADTRAGKCGFVVDRVIGDHHTVIKKLGSLYRHVEEISGATILGDGTVALILDVDQLAIEVIRGGRHR